MSQNNNDWLCNLLAEADLLNLYEPLVLRDYGLFIVTLDIWSLNV